MKCASLTKAAFTAIGGNANIHWFCDACDNKIMGFISRAPHIVEQRQQEAQQLTKAKEDLSKLANEMRALDIKKKLELFEGVTVCLGPKIQHLQDTVQKIETKVETMSNRSWSEVAAQKPQPQNNQFWNPEASVVINSIKDFTETKNSSTIKTELSKGFREVKFKTVMKRANGNIIIETENKEAANKMKENWPENLFGGSSCRLTKKKIRNEVILKDVPLPTQIERTGVSEDDLTATIQEKYPKSKVQRFKRRDGTPMHMVKVITETVEEAEDLVKNGFLIGCLWVQAEYIKANRNRVIQCYKCLRLGHIAPQCNFNQRCSKCGEEGHKYTQCTCHGTAFKCANCSGNHQAVSQECKIIKDKLKELIDRQNRYEI